MSRWWGDQIHADLGPQRVTLVRIRRGIGRQTPASWDAELEPGADLQDWRPAAAALDTGLRAMNDRRRTQLRVRISNQFVRYCVLPWSDELRSESEVRTFARHRLRETYGEVADAWTLSLAAGWPGCPRLAAAAEPELVAAIVDAAKRAQARLAAIEPRFSAFADSRRRRLKGADFWVAQAESGRIVLARASRGEWVSLATARDGGEPAQSLLSMLARESFSQEATQGSRRLYTSSVAPDEVAALAQAGWDVVPADDDGSREPMVTT